jgi:hypothetical protein
MAETYENVIQPIPQPIIASEAGAATRKRLPQWTKILLTAFAVVWASFYWKTYGPTNFLYFCDVALIMTVVAIWTESALLASTAAVGILVPQAFWCVDFFAELSGNSLSGMTSYMFDEKIPLFARGLSFFHFWLPFLLVWMVWKLGYDRRAPVGWTLLGWALLLVCYFAMPAPPTAEGVDPNIPVNINYVHGFSDEAPQTLMPPGMYLALMFVLLPLAVCLPAHALLDKYITRRDQEPTIA